MLRGRGKERTRETALYVEQFDLRAFKLKLGSGTRVSLFSPRYSDSICPYSCGTIIPPGEFIGLRKELFNC